MTRLARGVGMVWGVLVIVVLDIGQLSTAAPGSFFGRHDSLPPRSVWKTTYACENSKLEVQCGDGEVIRIMLANYGRYSISVCNRYGITEGWNLQCISVLSFRVVSERCDGRRHCEMMANNRVFGDPCPDTSKYAEVKYYCQPVETSKPPTSESFTTTTTQKLTETSTTSTTTSTTTTTTTTKPPTTTTTTPPPPPITAAQPTPSFHFKFSNTPSPTKQSSVPMPSNATKKATWPPAEISSDPETSPLPDPPSTYHPYGVQICDRVRADGVMWPTTMIGQRAEAKCPGQLRGTARWLCSERGWVGGPDLSDCISPWVEEIDENIDEVLQGEGSSEQVITELETMTGGEINAGDLKRTTQKLLPKLQQALATELEAAKDQPASVRRKKVKKFTESFVKTSSNLLARKQKKSWDKLPKSQTEEAATSLIVSVEKSAFHVADVLESGKTNSVVSENLVVEVNVRNVRGGIDPMTFPSPEVTKDSPWMKRSDSISIPARTLVNAAEKGVIRVIFVVYNNLEQFLQPRMARDQPEKGPESTIEDRSTPQLSNEIIVDTPSRREEEEEEKEQIVNSNIISAAINNREEMTNLVEPVEFTLQHLNIEERENPVCSYWDMDSRQRGGKWSQDGCRLKKTNLTHTTCECNHLTNFAVLMDITGTKLSEGHQLSLRIITYVGCIISIVCLLFSWATFVAFKNLQCDRTTIHKHLVYNLMLAEIIFLVGIGQTELKILCSIIAGLLHFLFLVVFAWMCLEGVQLYVMLIEVFETERSRLKWYYLLGYGVPLLIVGISAAVYHQGYGTDIHCWLTTERHFNWSFIGPALFVMSVNVAMLSIAIYMMCKHANTANSLKEKTKLQKLRAWIKGALVLVVLLGLTWSVGLLYLGKETVAVAYIFTILNSLQGVFIFVFHCIMNEKVQKEYRKIARRTTWLPNCIRVNYGGYNGHLSSSPNQSSGSGHNYFSRLFPGRRRNRSASASTNSSTKPILSSRGHRRSDVTDSSTSRESSLYPSSINGYVYTANNNDPHKSPKLNGNGFSPLSPCFENGGIAGELSEVIDCSVIDSEAVTEYCHNNLQVCEEKKRYSSGSEDFKPDEEDEHDRLSALSYESIAKNRDSFISASDTDDDGHSVTAFKKGDSERNLINNILKKAGFRKNGVSKVKKQSPSLGNINDQKAKQLEEKVNTSTPNLKYKDSGKRPEQREKDNNHAVQHSMPDLSQKHDAVATVTNGYVTPLAFKSKIKRLSSDIQIRFDPHRYDLSSTDC